MVVLSTSRSRIHRTHRTHRTPSTRRTPHDSDPKYAHLTLNFYLSVRIMLPTGKGNRTAGAASYGGPLKLQWTQHSPKRQATPFTPLRDVAKAPSPYEKYSRLPDGSHMVHSDGTPVGSSPAMPGGWIPEVPNSPHRYTSKDPNFQVPISAPGRPGGLRAL